jgi:hypothetical protein
MPYGVRVAVDYFIPTGEGVDAPTVTIHRGGDDGSWLDVPVAAGRMDSTRPA